MNCKSLIAIYYKTRKNLIRKRPKTKEELLNVEGLENTKQKNMERTF